MRTLITFLSPLVVLGVVSCLIFTSLQMDAETRLIHKTVQDGGFSQQSTNKANGEYHGLTRVFLEGRLISKTLYENDSLIQQIDYLNDPPLTKRYAFRLADGHVRFVFVKDNDPLDEASDDYDRIQELSTWCGGVPEK